MFRFFSVFSHKIFFMTKLILEVPNQQDLELLLAFAKRLKVNVLQVNKLEQSPIYWLEQLAAINCFEDLKDPVAWQREQRAERVLPFRD